MKFKGLGQGLFLKKAVLHPDRHLWVCRGTVLQGETGAPQDGHCYEPSVLYDTNAQLLAVDPSVYIFKMWYTTGWGTRGIYYAESLDGIYP